MNIFKSIARPFGKFARLVKYLARARRQSRQWHCIAVHRHDVTRLPAPLVLPLIAGPVKGKLSCPDNLTVLLVHNYENEPLVEKSLRYAGIDNFTVQKISSDLSWSNSQKIVEIHKFLERGACRTDYVLFLDSDDVVIRDDPAKAIDLLKEEGCEMLISNTSLRGDYASMPETRKWADGIVEGEDVTQPYLNSGVFISTTSFLKELMGAAMDYVTDDDLTRAEYQVLRKSGGLASRLPDFPRGVGCDQVILRYLHPRFYPRMKIDYQSRLAIR